jgi:succinate dehydrogenase / fumarate reductase, cytochrome b subunit
MTIRNRGGETALLPTTTRFPYNFVSQGSIAVSQAATTSVASSDFAGSSHFLFRRLHSLTGIIFGGYIVIHLITNATLAQGTSPDMFQAQVDKIHSLPFLWAIEWVFIYLPILYHTVYGLWILVGGRPNNERYPFVKNYLYLLQRVSAVIIIFFLAFHVLGMKGFWGSTLEFVPGDATHSVVRHINSSFLVAYFIYPIGILASCFHLANGFFTAAITWGLTISAGAQKRWGYVCSGIFVFTLLCGFLALGAAIHDKAIWVH